jgi:DNA-binding transcriptional LysR family regulator
MDKLLAMKMFVGAVDAQGFSAAARTFEVATSSVTRLIDALEAELGATLLNRSTRQVTVTEAGARYYRDARRILDQIAEADAQVADRGDEPVGLLRVCVPVEFGRRKVAPLLGQLLAQYPALELDITLSDSLDDLLGERFDVAIRLGQAAPGAEVVSRHLADFQRWAVASPAWLASHGTAQHPSELADLHCLQFSYGAGAQTWTFRQAEQQVCVPINGRLKSSNADVLREAAVAGAGIALLADWLVSDDVRSGRLVRILQGWQAAPGQATGSINALYLPNHRGSRRVNAFIGFVEQALKA